MTNPSSCMSVGGYTTAILMAALMLSSGVCLSEAFSAAASLIRTTAQQQPWRTRLSYAPKDSLENVPKRRRGRPRKSATAASSPASQQKTKQGKKPTARIARKATTSTTLAAAVAAADPGVKKRAKRSANGKVKVKNNKNKRVISHRLLSSFRSAMLDHELLSKDEEKVLGEQIQRAKKVKEALSIWLEEQQTKQQAHDELIQRMQNDNDDDEDDDYLNLSMYGFKNNDDDDGDDLMNDKNGINPLLYGTATSQAMERHILASQEEDELFYQDGTPFEGEEAFGMSTYDDSVIFEQHPQKPAPYTPESWMDDIMEMDRRQVSPLQPTNDMMALTDEVVRKVLDLPGGRSQLREVFLEGALAREKLIRCNVKLVTSIAQRWVGDVTQVSASNEKTSVVQAYIGGGPSSVIGRPTLDEAIQEGVLGLQEAAIRYDHTRGFRFSTYATVWVTNSIRKRFQLESTSGMRLPVKLYELKRAYVARVRDYLKTQKELPPMAQMAEDLGVTEKRLVTALRLTQPLASLDAPIGQAVSNEGVASDYSLATLLASDEPLPEDHVERSLLRQCLENAMATELTPVERDVLRLRLGLDDGVIRTAQEVANGAFAGRMTAAAVRGVEQRAYNKLRTPWAVHTHNLLAYLDFAGIAWKSTI